MKRAMAYLRATEPPIGDPPPDAPVPDPEPNPEDEVRARRRVALVRHGAYALALAALATLPACDISTGSNPTYITNTATNNQPNGNNGGPTASPSPGGGACPGSAIIAKIRVNPFGYDCPDGVPKPNNNSGLLPVGCTAAVTATPKDQFGNDVPAELHGTEITWRIVAGSEFITVTSDPNEAFNKNVFGKSGPGEFVLEATVCGKSGAWEGRTTVQSQSSGLARFSLGNYQRNDLQPSDFAPRE